jgi:hypothetical protein
MLKDGASTLVPPARSVSVLNTRGPVGCNFSSEKGKMKSSKSHNVKIMPEQNDYV